MIGTIKQLNEMQQFYRTFHQEYRILKESLLNKELELYDQCSKFTSEATEYI